MEDNYIKTFCVNSQTAEQNAEKTKNVPAPIPVWKTTAKTRATLAGEKFVVEQMPNAEDVITELNVSVPVDSAVILWYAATHQKVAKTLENHQVPKSPEMECGAPVIDHHHHLAVAQVLQNRLKKLHKVHMTKIQHNDLDLDNGRFKIKGHHQGQAIPSMEESLFKIIIPVVEMEVDLDQNHHPRLVPNFVVKMLTACKEITL